MLIPLAAKIQTKFLFLQSQTKNVLLICLSAIAHHLVGKAYWKVRLHWH